MAESDTSIDEIHSKICRLCLNIEPNAIKLRYTSNENAYFLKLAEYCYGIKIDMHEDLLPLSICQDCTQYTFEFYRLKKLYTKNQKFLRNEYLSCVKKIREMNENASNSNGCKPNDSCMSNDTNEQNDSYELSDSCEPNDSYESIDSSSLKDSYESIHSSSLNDSYLSLDSYEQIGNNEVNNSCEPKNNYESKESKDDKDNPSLKTNYQFTPLSSSSSSIGLITNCGQSIPDEPGDQTKLLKCLICNAITDTPDEWKSHMLAHFYEALEQSFTS